ncbi:peptide ABC transporter substrate-binding protein [Roseiterribacter gracilis]|uniref:peptide ABC transporter substrate-binding protein n=1 Tax=Roseiterribacter gracilis TaxID=2812848 RepID=UPI003B43210C
MNKKKIALAAVALVAVAAYSLWPTPNKAPSLHTLRIAVTQFPNNLHPAIGDDMAKSLVLAPARPQLVGYDSKLEPVCLACEGAPRIERNGANDDVVLTLRDGLAWDDGVKVGLDDFAFTLEVGRASASGIVHGSLYRDEIVGITARDARTIVLQRNGHRCDAAALPIHLLPAHIERPVFLANPDDYRAATRFDTAPATPGLSWSAYRVERLEPGERLLLARNPHWPGPPAFFDRLIVSVRGSGAALRASLLAGEVDLVPGEAGLGTEQALEIEQRHSDRFQVLWQDTLAFSRLTWPLDDPRFADLRVRRALAYGLDRDALLRTVLAGKAKAATSSTSPILPYAANVESYGHDPARANALLEEAGWRRGTDGVRRDKNGKRLEFEIVTTAGNRERELAVQVIAADWGKLGVAAHIRLVEPRVLFGEMLPKRTIAGVALTHYVQEPDVPPRALRHSSSVPDDTNGHAGVNFSGYRSPQMDALLDQLATVCDPAARAQVWRALQQLEAAELPDLPLWFAQRPTIAAKWLQSIEPVPSVPYGTAWAFRWRDSRTPVQ